jgi:diguanylate cyclase (GGDEF)-like protein
MLIECARTGHERRPNQERESRLSDGSLAACQRRRLPCPALLFRVLPAFALLFGLLIPASFALDLSDATAPKAHVRLISAARTTGVHAAHSEFQTPHLWPMIQQIRFNQEALSFDQGITVGPGEGDLEIQFAPAASVDHLRYRLIGFDTEWKEAGKQAEVLYSRLAPGRYEFDFQMAEGTGLKGSLVQGIPITVIAPWWETARFRGLCVISLLFVILVLYRVHVSWLVKHNRKLQESVTQTRAELTLTAKMAGDAQEALKEQALKDSLTGLWNRRAIFAMLERETFRAQRDHFPITLVMIDLDHFKNINDTYGHLTGDEVLRETAARLTDAMRPYDFAGRYGGEEFLVVLPSCSTQNGLQRAEHFRRAIADKMLPTAMGPLAVTCSLGVAAYEDGMPPEDLIHRADEALYRAKRLGRNCVCAGN